jgi:hypothetical protein
MKMFVNLPFFKIKNLPKKISLLCVYAFSFIGLSFVVVYFAVKIGLTNTEGVIDTQNTFFQKENDTSYSGGIQKLEHKDVCTLLFVQKNYPSDFFYTKNSLLTLSSESLEKISAVYKIFVAGDSSYQNFIKNCPRGSISTLLEGSSPELFVWAKGDDWATLEEALLKDKDVIERVSRETGVPARLLITPLVVEQLRLYSSQREIFKKYFAPLKVLGAQTQFSWGIYGIKKETAVQIEKNLKDKKSPFYLGNKYENSLDFTEAEKGGSSLVVFFGSSASTTTPQESETFEGVEKARFVRLTSEKDHYYSYLYAALYMKQIMSQWKNAGYDLDHRPEIVATLYNIGFMKSIPKENPSVGGAEITIRGVTYSFGRLAYEFYYSGLLEKTFPLK